MTGSRKKKLFDDDETPAYVYVLVVIAFVAVIMFSILFDDKIRGWRYSRFYDSPAPTATQSDSTD